MKYNDLYRDKVISIKNGFPCGEWNDNGNGILHLRPFNITNTGCIDLSLRKFVDIDRKLDSYQLEERDVLFNNTNSEELVGKTAIWKNAQKAVLSNHMTIIRIEKKDQVSPEFIAFHLLFHWFKGYFQLVCRRHVNQASVSVERIKDLPFPNVSIKEQRRIAAILTVVQRAIEQQERLIALTDELKKALMQKLFTEGTRGEQHKMTEIGPVPESWTVDRLDKICLLQRGFDITKKEQQNGNIPVVSSGGIKSYHNVVKVKGPGVVIGRKGTLGTVHYIESDYWPHDTTLWVKDFKGNNPRFIAYLLEIQKFDRYDSGVANPTLNRNTIHVEIVACPRINEQIEIANNLSSIDKKLWNHTVIKNQIQALFHTLLHLLMTAQIRVNEVDLSELKAIGIEVD